MILLPGQSGSGSVMAYSRHNAEQIQGETGTQRRLKGKASATAVSTYSIRRQHRVSEPVTKGVWVWCIVWAGVMGGSIFYPTLWHKN